MFWFHWQSNTYHKLYVDFFLWVTTLLRYSSSCSIQFTHLNYLFHWILVFHRVVVTITRSTLEPSHCPPKEAVHPLVVTFHGSSTPYPPAQNNFYLASWIVYSGCLWTHILYGLLWLAPLIWHDIFKVHPIVIPFISFTDKFYSILWMCRILLSTDELMGLYIPYSLSLAAFSFGNKKNLPSFDHIPCYAVNRRYKFFFFYSK